MCQTKLNYRIINKSITINKISESTPMAIHWRLSAWKKRERERKREKKMHLVKQAVDLRESTKWAHGIDCGEITVIHVQHFCHFLHGGIDLWFRVFKFITKIIEHAVWKEKKSHLVKKKKKMAICGSIWLWGFRSLLTQLAHPIRC